MENQRQATKVILGPVRISYAHLFTPTAMDENSEKKYSVSLIIPKSDKKMVAQINKAIAAAEQQGLNTKFGGVMPKKYKNITLRDGDEDRPDDEVYANSYFINASCKKKPQVVGKDLKPVMDESEVYSGCYCCVSVNFYAYNVNGNKGIAAGLNNVMKARDGEPLGGRESAENDFAGIAIDDDDDDFS